jgi:hypothetical protein
LTSSGCSRTASEIEQKMTPAFFNFRLEGRATETESNTRHQRPTPAEHFLLAQRNAELLVGLEQFRIDLVQRFRPRLVLRRGVIIGVL